MSRRRLSTKLGGAAVTNLIALTLVYALFGNALLEARVSASARGDSKPTMQERVLEIPAGTMIEVNLLNKQKLRGRLGEVTSDGFSLQTAQGNKIETQQIAFTDVKSVKQVGETGKKVGSRLTWMLVGVGVLVLVIAIVSLASGD
jgi:hypothetical protein